MTPEVKRAVLAELLAAWEYLPEQRLGQLLMNWLASTYPDHLPSRPLSVLGYMEDGDLAHNVRLWARSHAVFNDQQPGSS